MAGRPTTKKETTDEVVETNTNDDVMTLLKQMQAELASLKKENETLKKQPTRKDAEDTLSSDDEIEVMSLFSGTLNLYTEGFGTGQKYPFEDGYGSIIDIPLGDLKLIVRNNNKIAKDGYFYIMNEDAVNACRLKTAYENLLSADQMEQLTRATDEQVVTLYKSAPNSQKELIVEYFANKKANKEPVSQNVLFQLAELSGKKLLD